MRILLILLVLGVVFITTSCQEVHPESMKMLSEADVASPNANKTAPPSSPCTLDIDASDDCDGMIMISGLEEGQYLRFQGGGDYTGCYSNGFHVVSMPVASILYDVVDDQQNQIISGLDVNLFWCFCNENGSAHLYALILGGIITINNSGNTNTCTF
ncbi:MAG: hypothetical protein AAF587_09030 [Bacteroidota bacterium]